MHLAPPTYSPAMASESQMGDLLGCTRAKRHSQGRETRPNGFARKGNTNHGRAALGCQGLLGSGTMGLQRPSP